MQHADRRGVSPVKVLVVAAVVAGFALLPAVFRQGGAAARIHHALSD